MPLTLIGLEEHFIGSVIHEQPPTLFMFPPTLEANLRDLSESRIRNMDLGNMSIQVVSHNSSVESPERCRKINDQLYDGVQANEDRLRGFAFLPMGDPEAIPDELERCIQELKFVGALIPNHAHGKYYDDKVYWPMFEKAQELDVPIYLHPTPTDDFRPYAGNYDHVVQTLLAGPALCWHTDIADHLIRLFGSGLFDAYPRLKIVLGHNGEAVPFMLDRISKMFGRKWHPDKQYRDWDTVWNENVWITTSGMFHLGPLKCCLDMCKPDRVMYSE